MNKKILIGLGIVLLIWLLIAFFTNGKNTTQNTTTKNQSPQAESIQQSSDVFVLKRPARTGVGTVYEVTPIPKK